MGANKRTNERMFAFFLLAAVNRSGNGGIEANERASNNKRQHIVSETNRIKQKKRRYILPILRENINFELKNEAMLPLERTNQSHVHTSHDCMLPCYFNGQHSVRALNSIWFFI